MAGHHPASTPQLSRARRSTVVRDLNPGAFAFVMATGVVSLAVRHINLAVVSGVLLVIGVVGYALLIVASAWRLLCWPRRVLDDLVSARGFAFLTVVAASNVLASRFCADGRRGPALVLLALGVVGWLVLGYGVPLGLITSRGREPGLYQVNGTWFIWVVATQSISVAVAALEPLTPTGALVLLGSVCWSIGLVLYVLLAALVLARLLLESVRAANLIPGDWVFMGAAAITVLAGAGLLGLPESASRPLPRDVIVGTSVVLWSFCTWLIPLLLALGVWRHLVCRVPLRYESGLWSIVFPVGMYGLASDQLGEATGIRWLTTLGSDEAWVAFAVWTVTFAAMLAAVVTGSGSPRRADGEAGERAAPASLVRRAHDVRRRAADLGSSDAEARPRDRRVGEGTT